MNVKITFQIGNVTMTEKHNVTTMDSAIKLASDRAEHFYKTTNKTIKIKRIDEI